MPTCHHSLALNEFGNFNLLRRGERPDRRPGCGNFKVIASVYIENTCERSVGCGHHGNSSRDKGPVETKMLVSVENPK